MRNSDLEKTFGMLDTGYFMVDFRDVSRSTVSGGHCVGPVEKSPIRAVFDDKGQTPDARLGGSGAPFVEEKGSENTRVMWWLVVRSEFATRKWLRLLLNSSEGGWVLKSERCDLSSHCLVGLDVGFEGSDALPRPWTSTT
jgi:hypothetical protein